MQKGKIRNPWGVILLTIITFGLYSLYWLLINPIEIKNAFKFEKGENQIKFVFVFMVIGVLLTILFTIITIIHSVNFDFESTFTYSTIYTLCMVFVGALFFYFLCSATALAQKKVKIEPFEIVTVFGVYLVYLLIKTGSELFILSSKFFKNLPSSRDEAKPIDIFNIKDIAPFMNFNGLINLLSLLLFFLFIYLLQKQFNRIWEEGAFEESQAG